MKKFYAGFVKVEEFLACFSLAAIVVLMFLSAVLRKLGAPINWAGDVSLLFFTWSMFFGADLSIREKGLVSVDMLAEKFPLRVRKTLRIVFQIVAMVFLISLTWYGFPLAIESASRKFSNMELSYSWATASVPVGCLLITITSAVNLAKMFRSEDGTYSNAEGGSDVC